MLDSKVFDFVATAADDAARLALMHEQAKLGGIVGVVEFLILFVGNRGKENVV